MVVFSGWARRITTVHNSPGDSFLREKNKCFFKKILREKNKCFFKTNIFSESLNTDLAACNLGEGLICWFHFIIPTRWSVLSLPPPTKRRRRTERSDIYILYNPLLRVTMGIAPCQTGKQGLKELEWTKVKEMKRETKEFLLKRDVAFTTSRAGLLDVLFPNLRPSMKVDLGDL